jgi:hypothetical protein
MNEASFYPSSSNPQIRRIEFALMDIADALEQGHYGTAAQCAEQLLVLRDPIKIHPGIRVCVRLYDTLAMIIEREDCTLDFGLAFTASVCQELRSGNNTRRRRVAKQRVLKALVDRFGKAVVARGMVELRLRLDLKLIV